jgi:hypothetical protein
LKVIKLFLDNNVLVNGDVLNAVKKSKNPQIEELFKLINQQSSDSSTETDKPSTSIVPTKTESKNIAMTRPPVTVPQFS